MIVSVYGKCNSADIVFSYSAGRWATTVPAAASGEYIIELHAADDAGNQAYFATLLLTFDTSLLTADVSVLDIDAAVGMDEVLHILSSLAVSIQASVTTVLSAVSVADIVLDITSKCL
jgi:hypothetical protein